MSENPLDRIADGIASLLTPKPSVVIPAELVSPELKPLTFSQELDAAAPVETQIDDLIRFTLPSFTSIQTVGLGVGQINGAGSGVLHFLPRKPANAVVVNFAAPIYGIWIDPGWTTPGALIGIGNGGQRSGYRVLGRGEGLQFAKPVTKLSFYNADGLDAIYPEVPGTAINIFPWGYLGFLVAYKPQTRYVNGIIAGGRCNVTKMIQSGPLVVNGFPQDGSGNIGTFGYLIPTLRLRTLGLNFVFASFVNNSIATQASATNVIPWKLTSMPTSLTGAWRSQGDDLDFSSQFNATWVRGRPLSLSAQKGNSTDFLNAGCTRQYRIDDDALAMMFTTTAIVNGDDGSGINNVNPATGLFFEAYGLEE